MFIRILKKANIQTFEDLHDMRINSTIFIYNFCRYACVYNQSYRFYGKLRSPF
jgi:hypothetical protein